MSRELLQPEGREAQQAGDRGDWVNILKPPSNPSQSFLEHSYNLPPTLLTLLPPDPRVARAPPQSRYCVQEREREGEKLDLLNY